jgi:CheY-like chemotaxis protein
VRAIVLDSEIEIRIRDNGKGIEPDKLADTLQLLVQSMDHDACAAYDGRSALALVRTFQPEVLLLDIGMPQMSGFEVARELQHLGGKKPVIIAVTGWGQTADRQRSREAGFDHHFVKPVSEETLRSVLAEIAAQAGPAGVEP